MYCAHSRLLTENILFQAYLPGIRAAAVEQWLLDDVAEPHTIVFDGVPCIMNQYTYPHKTISSWHQARVRIDKTDPQVSKYAPNKGQVVIPIFRHVTMSVATSFTYKCTGWSHDFNPIIVPDYDVAQHTPPLYHRNIYSMLGTITKVTNVSPIFRNQLHQSRATNTPIPS